MPYATSNENFLTASPPLLWLLNPMASCSMTYALYLAIALESKDFNTIQTWVGIFLKHTWVGIFLKHIICLLCLYLLSVSSRCAKQEEERRWVFLKFQK